MRRIARPLLRLLVAGLGAGAAVLALVAFAVFSIADDDETGRFQRFIEDQISSPDMQIRLGKIDGALSSDVRFSEITIADRKGVWLRIENPHLVWSRLALLRGKLSIDSLTADRVEISRKPDMQAAETPEVPEDSEFALPELPVVIDIGQMAIARIELGEPVAGIAATLKVDGSMRLEDGSLASDLAIVRLDQPAEIGIKLAYDKGDDQLDVDIKVREDKNGLLSTLLDIRGRPALAFTAKGSGPVSDFTADIGLSADAERLVAGTVALSRPDGGQRVVADIAGNLQRLIPEAYADLFDSGSKLFVDFTKGADGRSAFTAKVASGLLTLTADGSLAKDGFPDRLVADGSLKAADGHAVALPGGNNDVTIGGAVLKARLGEGGTSGRWTLDLSLDDLRSPDFSLQRFAITGGGTGTDLGDAAKRAFTFDIAGEGSGIATRDPGIGKAFGERITLAVKGSARGGEPVHIQTAHVAGATFEAGFAGDVAADAMTGSYRLLAHDLSAFSALADRALAGSLTLAADGRVGFSGSDVALDLDISGRDLDPGSEVAARLLAGATRITGKVTLAESKAAFDGLRFDNPQLVMTADGQATETDSNVVFRARLGDASLLNDKVRGAIEAQGKVSGPLPTATVSLVVLGSNVVLADKPFRDATLTLHGKRDGEAFAGDLDLRGHLAEKLVAMTAKISRLADGTSALSDLDALLAGTTVRGNVSLNPAGIATGAVAVDAPDLAEVAPLLLTDIAGTLKADITLSERDADQAVALKAHGEALSFGTTRIGSVVASADVGRLSGVPEITGSADLSAVRAGGLVLRTVTLKASPEGEATRFAAEAALTRGRFATGGTLAPIADGYAVALDRLSLTGTGTDVALARPASLTAKGGTVAIEPLELRIGQGGRLRVAGSAGDLLDISAELANVPLALANAFMPNLGAAGTLSGSARASGPSSDPQARFAITGNGVSVAALAEAGIAPLKIGAEGQYGGNRIALSKATVTGSDGLSIAAHGTVPLGSGSLNVPVTGTVPLSLARKYLDPRGARLTGKLALNVTVTGPLSRPLFNGTIGGDNIAFKDPQTGIDIRNTSLRIGLSGRRVTLERIRAGLGKGSITVGGVVEIDDAFTLPGDISVTLDKARYSDGTLVTATASGAVTVRGPLLRAPVIGGKIVLDRTEILVPTSLPGGAAAVDVTHRDASAGVRQTLARAGLAGPKANTNSGFGAEIDLTVEAPARLFIRGRGLDTELSGRIRLHGTDRDLVPEGSFSMVRGRLDILGKRITFSTGEVSLVGDFDPYLHFVAKSQRGKMVVTITVEGLASDPKITFSSEPELPQDEVLAQLLFGQSVDNLSAFQLARLAAAAAELAGKGGPGILSSVRQATGLDDLDVTTDDKGKTAVKAGTYISDNIYLGVQAGEESSVSINLDIARGVKLKGQAGQTDSGVGLFYEKEY